MSSAPLSDAIRRASDKHRRVLLLALYDADSGSVARVLPAAADLSWPLGAMATHSGADALCTAFIVSHTECL